MRFSLRTRKKPSGPQNLAGVVLTAGTLAKPHPEPQWPEATVTCPTCAGTDLFWSLTCHTYALGDGEERRWKACLPCDSAVEYECADEDCGWSYTHGLNPDNPRTEWNEQRRPPWLPEKLAFGPAGIALTRPGIPAIWEHGHE